MTTPETATTKVAETHNTESKPKRVNTIDIPLLGGMELDGATVGSVTMRRPRVIDQRTAHQLGKGDPVATETILFSNLCNVPVEAFDTLDWDDYLAIQDGYNSFLSR